MPMPKDEQRRLDVRKAVLVITRDAEYLPSALQLLADECLRISKWCADSNYYHSAALWDLVYKRVASAATEAHEHMASRIRPLPESKTREAT